MGHICHPFLVWLICRKVSLKQILSHTLRNLILHVKPAFPSNAGLKAELLHETQYLLVIHPYAVILPQEQLELPVAIFSFVAMVHLANESHGLDIPIVLLSLQVYVVTTSRNTRKLAQLCYLAWIRCLFDKLESLFLTSCIQIFKHFFSIAFSRFNC
ncbi:hypothetical protein D1872_259030 [compost metagenome]